MAAETAQTLERGIRILYLLAGCSDGLTVTELSRALAVSRTIVYRLAVTLEGNALLRRGIDGRYRLGLGVLAIARQIQPMLRDAAAPSLHELATACDATAFMVVCDGDDALTVAVAEPAGSGAHVARRVGHRCPLALSAGGMAILERRAAGAAAGADRRCVNLPLVPGPSGFEVAAVLDLPGVEAAVGVLQLGRLGADQVASRVLKAAGDVSIGHR